MRARYYTIEFIKFLRNKETKRMCSMKEKTLYTRRCVE